MWFLAWIPFALLHGHNPFRTNYLFSPSGVDLFSFTSMPLLGLIAAPITLTLGPVVALSVLLRLSFAASAASLFFVLGKWCRWPYAFAGGLLYGFSPFLVTQSQNHLFLAFMPLLPILLWCVYEIFVSRMRSPLKMGVLLGVVAAMQFFVSFEMLTLLAVVLGTGVVVYVVSLRRELRTFISSWGRALGSALIAFLLLTGYNIYEFLFGPGHLTGPIQSAQVLQSYSADLLGPIIPTANQLLTTASLSHVSAGFVSGNTTDNVTYLGLPLVLVLCFMGVALRHNRRVVAPLALAALALVLSLGNRLTIDGHRTSIPMPASVLARLPLLNNIVPARFGAIVMLFACVALAVGAEALVDEIRTRPATETIAKRFVAVLAVLVFLPVIPAIPLQTGTAAVPGDIGPALASIPTGTEVLTYPYPSYAWTEPMNWQSDDHMSFRLLGGYLEPHPPPLLSPQFVQEFFLTSEDGYDPSYPPINPNVNPRRALEKFLVHNGVGAVVFWNTGSNPQAVRRLLVDTLGTPVYGDGTGVQVWILGRAYGIPDTFVETIGESKHRSVCADVIRPMSSCDGELSFPDSELPG